MSVENILDLRAQFALQNLVTQQIQQRVVTIRFRMKFHLSLPGHKSLRCTLSRLFARKANNYIGLTVCDQHKVQRVDHLRRNDILFNLIQHDC